MSRTTLTEARIRALKPRKTAYVLRDSKLRGFGVRMLPSGRKRFFVHCQHRGERVWKIVGDAATMDVREARSRATAMLAAIRRGEDVSCETAEGLFEAVAETVFRRHERVWKSGTLYVNRCYLRNQLLPHFAGRRIADIGRDDVRNWFASLHATPVAADRSMPVLSVIMREAEAMGLRPEGSNPCRGIRRYRRKGRERFLSDEEIRRLSATLSAHADRRPGQVAVIRLLLLTGCRKSEILTLRWSDYREGHLFLRDSKTGPRTVWLSQPARRILDALERTGPWVFQAAQGNRPRSAEWLNRFWRRVRTEPSTGLHAAALRRVIQRRICLAQQSSSECAGSPWNGPARSTPNTRLTRSVRHCFPGCPPADLNRTDGFHRGLRRPVVTLQSVRFSNANPADGNMMVQPRDRATAHRYEQAFQECRARPTLARPFLSLPKGLRLRARYRLGWRWRC